jgi:hypothetical protein
VDCCRGANKVRGSRVRKLGLIVPRPSADQRLAARGVEGGGKEEVVDVERATALLYNCQSRGRPKNDAAPRARAPLATSWRVTELLAA